MGIEGTPRELFDERFDREFERRETIQVGGGNVEVLDISPDTLKNDTPVVLLPGYGDGSPIGRKTNVLELAKHGRRTIMLKTPRSVEAPEQESDEEIPQMFQRELRALDEVLQSKGIPRINAIGESAGAITTIFAAYTHPERFENIILVHPGGFGNDDSWAKLTMRFIAEGMRGVFEVARRKKTGKLSSRAEEQLKAGTILFKKHILGAPRSAKQDITDMAHAEIHSMLKKIHEAGVGISIIHGVDDGVFRMKAVQRQLKTTPDAPLYIDGFYSVRGGHGEFNYNPEIYTRACETALSALEAKQERRRRSDGSDSVSIQ